MKEQSSSTSESSPNSSEKDYLRSESVSGFLETPTKYTQVPTTQVLEFLLSAKPAQEFAATSREEELYAHILRVTKRGRGPKVASQMATLLPKPRSLSKAITNDEDSIGKAAKVDRATIQPPTTTKQKRKIRGKADNADSQHAKDLDLAGDLLYSAAKKEHQAIPTSRDPITTCSKPTVDDDSLNYEFDTMSLTPLRGRQYSESR